MFDNSQIQLNERAETLLQLLIRRYIDQGEPVGSRTLSREPGLGLSPATIRNVMSDLEELGLIRSPHTSAGRVPTQLGYRIFVDTMMKVKPLNNEAIEEISGGFARAHDPNELIELASELVSQITHFAGIVMFLETKAHGFDRLSFCTCLMIGFSPFWLLRMGECRTACYL